MRYAGERLEAAVDTPVVEQLVRDFIAAYNRRDDDAIVALTDPAMVIYPTPLSRPLREIAGHDGIRAWIETVRRENPSYRADVLGARAIDVDRWAVRGRIVVHDEQASPLVMLVRVKDGKLSEMRSYLSDEEVLRELGLIG
jgi:ketosteroid isomerase-like protein